MALSQRGAGLVNDLYFVRMHSFSMRETVTGTGKLSWAKLTFVRFIASMLVDVKLKSNNWMRLVVKMLLQILNRITLRSWLRLNVLLQIGHLCGRSLLCETTCARSVLLVGYTRAQVGQENFSPE